MLRNFMEKRYLVFCKVLGKCTDNQREGTGEMRVRDGKIVVQLTMAPSTGVLNHQPGCGPSE